MTERYVELKTIAELFQVHPRTILRAVTRNHNTYWADRINQHHYPVKAIAEAYGITEEELVRIIERRDDLLSPKQAAKVLGISIRALRARAEKGKYKKITCGGIVRYFHSRLIRDLIDSL